MKKEIAALRDEMKKRGISAYIVPTSDFHGSEYVNSHFKCREFLSGFTGSAGTLIVTADEAKLWTDGRYFLQAEAQLAGSGIELMKMGEPGVPSIEEYLAETLAAKDSSGSGRQTGAAGRATGALGFDGRVINAALGKTLAENYKISCGDDLTAMIWKNRPAIQPSQIYRIPDSVTGETCGSKLYRIREAMKEAGADYHLISSLDDIAWIYNLRGDDVENTPVFFAYTLISKDRARLYVMDNDLKSTDTAEVLPYGQIAADISALEKGTVLLDEDTVNYALFNAVPGSVKIVNGPNPSKLMKAVKNGTEIAGTKKAHLKDGAAVVNFIYWLKSNIGKIPMSEISAADYLKGCRKAQDGFRDLSFSTISGYASNAAIIHYAPTPETNKALQPEGFLLVDSGGQYSDGTTDITRTIALGPLTEEMKSLYTAVLRCHIALSAAKFSRSTLCADLDKMTREPLKALGYDYNHGTGHGVGHLLSVHEGPQSISRKGKDSTMRPGMITSDEPGVYLEGKYGIRIENEILCVEKKPGVLEFEPITFCPYEREAVDPGSLTQEERSWLNAYHENVYKALAPYLDENVRLWLRDVTREI